MATQHTQGPWKFGIATFDENDKYTIIEKDFNYRGPGYYENPSIYGADNLDVVGCDEYYIFNSPADARLICAAPDLLEALQELFADYKSLADSGDAGFWSLEEQDVGKKAISAIAKATGKQA